MRRAAQHAGRWLWAQRRASAGGAASGDVATAASQYALRQCSSEAAAPGALAACPRLLHQSSGASAPAAPRGSHPAASPDASKVQIMLKAHERRYIQAASTTIRDLLMLNCLPKLLAQAPPTEHGGGGGGGGAPPPEVWLPMGDAAIPQRLTRYTVIRGPHVDKKSREQFERKVHKRCISVPAIEEHELRWLLDSLKLYEFPGGRGRVGAAGQPGGGASVGCGAGSAGGPALAGLLLRRLPRQLLPPGAAWRRAGAVFAPCHLCQPAALGGAGRAAPPP
jgi:hypothetical protein